MINIGAGLLHSFVILEHLRNDRELVRIPIDVGCFTNCREEGLVFRIMNNNGKSFTWCVYEHRNSDEIIINGKEGYVSVAGDLPYKGDSKYIYIASFKYNQHYEAAEKLSKLIQEFWEKNEKQKGKKR